MKNLQLITNIAFLSAIFISSGCSTIQTKVSKNYHLKSAPVRVAVLPFDLSPIHEDEKETASIMRNIFYNYFSYLGYIDMNINEIDKILVKNELTSTEDIYLLSPEKMGELLGVDAIIYCTINRLSNTTAWLNAETSIEAKFRMVDTGTGLTIWKADSREIYRYRIPKQATPITPVQKQIDDSKKKKVIRKVAEESSRKIVTTIPDPYPFMREKINLPKILSLQTNFNNSVIDGEDFVLEVYMKGEKGMKASFDIGNWKMNVPMQEKTPGKYIGRYVMEKKDSIQKSLLIGKLENSNGLVSKKIYEEGLIL